MEELRYEHFPPHIQDVRLAFFENVRNAGALRKRIIAAATAVGKAGDAERAAVNFAFIDPRPIAGRLHLFTAIHQAMLTETQGTLRTKTMHSEILWCLNPNNNITESIRRFGISDKGASLLLVRIGGEDKAEAVTRLMKALVEGDMIGIEEGFAKYTDWSLISKYYKIGGERRAVQEVAISSVAMKAVAG